MQDIPEAVHSIPFLNNGHAEAECQCGDWVCVFQSCGHTAHHASHRAGALHFETITGDLKYQVLKMMARTWLGGKSW